MFVKLRVKFANIRAYKFVTLHNQKEIFKVATCRKCAILCLIDVFYFSLHLFARFLSSIYFLSQSNTAQFQNAGFDVASVEPVNRSTDELSTGAIVGIVIGAMVIALVVVVVLLTVLSCWWMR